MAAQQLAVQQQQCAMQANFASIQQQAQVAQSSIAQLSTINQAAHQRSQGMGQTQQSNPAYSMQSGPQSASIYAGSASIPRPSGLTASQQMVSAWMSGMHAEYADPSCAAPADDDWEEDNIADAFDD